MIAVILAVIIIYLTYLFIMYALEHPRKKDITFYRLHRVEWQYKEMLKR